MNFTWPMYQLQLCFHAGKQSFLIVDIYTNINLKHTALSNKDEKYFNIVEWNIFMFNVAVLVAIVLYMYIYRLSIFEWFWLLFLSAIFKQIYTQYSAQFVYVIRVACIHVHANKDLNYVAIDQVYMCIYIDENDM